MRRTRAFTAALLLLLGAVCLALAGRLPAGVRRERTAAGTLWLPEGAASAPAALVLSERGDAHRGLCLELCRRGLVVLETAGAAAPAWEELAERQDTRLSSLSLLAGPGRSPEALALAESLCGGGRECGALVFLGGAAIREEAFASPVRNLLSLDREGEELFTGYFAEGTARRGMRVSARRWDAREILEPVIDWLGSSLGHAVEIPDGDLLAPGRRVWKILGIAFLIAGALAALGTVCGKKES